MQPPTNQTEDELSVFLWGFLRRYLETRTYTQQDMDRVLDAAEAGNADALTLDQTMLELSVTWQLEGGLEGRKRTREWQAEMADVLTRQRRLL